MARRRTDEGTAGGGSWTGWIKPAIGILAVGIAGFLLHRTLGQYAFDDLLAAVLAVPAHNLALAGLFAAASYFCLTWFDWLALHYVGRPQPWPKAAVASFCALSIGHNLGFAALSSGAIRYRFYSRYGLSTGDIAKVILFCGLTVGLGLAMLAGLSMTIQPAPAARVAGLSEWAVQAVGVTCLAAGAGYLGLAATVRAPLRIRKWTLEMPSPRLAMAQLAIGPLNFACVAACLHQAVSAIADVGYFEVAGVYVGANVATLITHAPGGLGVIESVVLYLLPASAQLVGAVLVFRFAYFLVPLAIGGSLFAATELARRGSPAPSRAT